MIRRAPARPRVTVMAGPRLILGTTNSVPVGTTDEEIESIYQESFKPLLRALYQNERIPFTLHYSGHLLSWLERHHSEYTDVLLEMVQRKQVELLGGGYYDAILSLIPRPDRIGQVESMTTLLRKRFRRRARGVWITGSVWDLTLPGTLRSCGMEYVFLDDTLFRESGFTGIEACRPLLTEDQGKTIIVFPVCRELCFISRNGKPADAIEYINRAGADNAVFTMIEDGRVFKEGPGRPKSGNTRVSWFENFMELIRESDVEVVLPYRLLRDYQPHKRGYFHSGLDQRRLLTASMERNLLYSKMQYTHVLVNQIRGDKYRRQSARESLWKGQSHSAYWLEGENGLLNNSFRKEAYRSLIDAEKTTRERGIFRPSVVMVDFDMDGNHEFLFQGQVLNAYVHATGAELFELDHLPTSWNYLDTIGPSGPGGSPFRNAFVDHFLPVDTGIDEFQSDSFAGLSTFPDMTYAASDVRREGKKLDFKVTGAVGQVPISLSKRYSFKRTAISVDYTISNDGESDLNAVFAPEINLSFHSKEADCLRLFVEGPKAGRREISPSVSVQSRTKSLTIEDLVNQTALAVSTGICDELWMMPIETRNGPTAKNTTYQGSRIVPRWFLDVGPGRSTSHSITISFD